jgi:dephospho-CoA kinase
MLVVGLTGSMGMGKSTAAAAFRARGIRVCDADAEVHKLYEGAAVTLIEDAFPGTTAEGKVIRPKLAAAVLADPVGFKRLEAIVHPLVYAAERAFLQDEAQRGAKLAVLEIPLLFETGGDARVDVVVVVSANEATQRERLLLRLGMTGEKLEGLLARQMADRDKRSRAHFVVDTNKSIQDCDAAIGAIVTTLENREGGAFERYWA